jgi:hypothetical protein
VAVNVHLKVQVPCLPSAANIPVSPVVAAGTYSTVTLQDLLGPSAVSVQPSAVIVKAEDPDWASAITPDDLPPVLLSVKVFDGVWPTATDPKSYWASDQVSAGALALA